MLFPIEISPFYFTNFFTTPLTSQSREKSVPGTNQDFDLKKRICPRWKAAIFNSPTLDMYPILTRFSKRATEIDRPAAYETYNRQMRVTRLPSFNFDVVHRWFITVIEAISQVLLPLGYRHIRNDRTCPLRTGPVLTNRVANCAAGIRVPMQSTECSPSMCALRIMNFAPANPANLHNPTIIPIG